MINKKIINKLNWKHKTINNCNKFNKIHNENFFLQGPITPHTIVTLPNTNGMQLLLCYDNEGVYVNTYGKVSKNIVLQWGELPTSVAYIGTGQIMGWGNKAIEIRWPIVVLLCWNIDFTSFNLYFASAVAS